MKRLILCVTMALFLCVNSSSAQQVTQQGNNFTQTVKAAAAETKTVYTYTDGKGNVYPVWLSSTGKAFIKRVSKKTGREYRQYVPEIGKKINPKAYKEND